MQFYALCNPGVGDNEAVTDYEYTAQHRVGDASKCPDCHRYFALREWLPPFKVWLRFWGEVHGDIAYFSNDLLVTERFRALYLDAGLTGLQFLGPAEVTKVFPRRLEVGLPAYVVARVTRARAAIDHEASGCEFESDRMCPTCLIGDNFLRRSRIVLQKGSWDGEDIFIARGAPGVHLTSERFKTFCEEHQILNVKLVDALDYSVDWHPKEY